ncbi:hypothetical protein DNTS_034609 [Danionella cerebrum]|uniref:Ras-GEF domain-containing protein n=1 Tax=Danionella cerebrum TaxID=2873325 RepID=A0A553N015_9TELE|nr:hypothetical protein DNTS_034609 [Danionella translucida]
MELVKKSPLLRNLVSKVLEENRSSLSHSLNKGPRIQKNVEAILSQRQLSESVPRSDTGGQSRHTSCVNNVSCACRALRNALLSNCQENWKAHIKLARVIRRTYMGLELVDWLMDHCEFIQCRAEVSQIWNITLELGILLSVEQSIRFEDSRSLYQFTFEECEAQSCDFRNQLSWTSAVHLLQKLIPGAQLYEAKALRCKKDVEKASDGWNPVLQMRALEHLTSTVQNELLAALARKAHAKSEIEDSSQQNHTDSHTPSDGPIVCQQGAGEDLSRMEMVQRLAKDGCRLLHSPLRTAQRTAESSSDAVAHVSERARNRGVMPLLPPAQRNTSQSSSSSSSCCWTGSTRADANMGSRRGGAVDLDSSGVPATLVEQEEDDEEDECSDTSSAERAAVPTFDVPYFRYIDEEEGAEEEDCWCSAHSLSSAEEEYSSDSCVSHRYGAVPASPEKILEYVLGHLMLDEEQGSHTSSETASLLDDFLLTYHVLMSASDLCQALLAHYCSKKGRMKEEWSDVLLRKSRVLKLLSQWNPEALQEQHSARLALKTLYRNVLDDLYEFPSLEKDLPDLQKLLRIQRRHTLDEYSPQRKLSLKENWPPLRGAPKERREVLCRVYVSTDSYLSVRTHSEICVQELLRMVAERLDSSEEELLLMALSYPGEKVVLHLEQCVFSSSLRAAERLHVCRRDLSEIMNPFTDNGQPRSVKMLSMNTWDVAVSLTNCDWNLFSNIHEQELVCFTLSRDTSAGQTVALEQLLQRCNETQQWLMTEVLLCTDFCKRVQLFKKFIKIAAHCKAQRNLNSFFAIIMGLNSPAVSRLSQTWEKVPGKFKKLLSDLESLTDPSFNHKAYRDVFRKMKAPKIPFLPLLLKDITFIHEGNKTFLDNLVNFDKLHMIADTVRILRQCRTDVMGNLSFHKDSTETRTYISYLHLIDNQQTLFELSHRLEPRTLNKAAHHLSSD